MRKDSVLAYIKEYAKTQPDTLAVCELRKTVTYEQYFMNIRKMAAVLMSAGIQKDEHVILKCTQNINYLTIFTALQYMGALPIPVEKATMPERMTEIGAQVEAKTLISDAEAEGMRFFSAKELEKQMAEAEPADCGLPKAQSRSMILFTTGTTGRSKGVVVKHINDVAVAENVIGGTHMRSHNVEIIPMPLNHAYGLRRYQSDMVNGGTVCLMDGMVFVGTLWKLMEKYQASSMALSPASLGMIFKLSGDRLAEYESQLDYIQIGSAPLVEADKQHLLSLMPNTRLYNFYGASEAGCSCILDFNSSDDKPGCIGKPTVNSVIRFTDENGNALPPAIIAPEEPVLIPPVLFVQSMLLYTGDASFCTKLTPRRILLEHPFEVGALCEDFSLETHLVDVLDGVYNLPQIGYRVVHRLGSLTRRRSVNQFSRAYIAIIEASDYVEKELVPRYPKLEVAARRFGLYERLDYMLHVPISQMNRKNEFYMQVLYYLRENKTAIRENPYLAHRDRIYLTILSAAPVLVRRVHRVSMRLRGIKMK